AGEYVLTYSVTDSEGLTTSKERIIIVKEIETEAPESTVDFGVGEGIEWPSQVNAPYIDMVSWITTPGYTNNGAPNLVKIAQDTDVLFYNLGFIQATGGIDNGIINWGWGGHAVLSERDATNSQYLGIKQSIRELRELGGDVTISLGGLNGIAFWEVTQDVEILTNTYRELINGYGLTRLDLDIEGAAQNKAHNAANAKAIKKVQDETGVSIVLTLPVLPSGLTQVQLDVLEVYLAAGVDVEIVNVMTMCYGEGTLLPGENYGTASLRAIDNTKDQVQEYFKTYAGIELSDEEAYRKLGTTPSIGFEGSAHPVFTTEWAELVVNHAIERGIGMTSFWSMNRDAMLESNTGVSTQYEFTNIFKSFGAETGPAQNVAPVLKGITNVTLTVGDLFDPFAGVSASDKEDGDLTASIVLEGEVNTQLTGEYVLTYSVSDREGLTTTATRIITVKEKENKAPVISGVKDTTITLGEVFNVLDGVTAYDEEDGDLTSSIVVEGSVDSNVGGRYTLTYSVTDSKGLTTVVNVVITVKDPNADTFDLTKVYLAGDTVIFNGETYTAKWWVQGEYPNESAAWEKEVTQNEDGSITYEPGMIFNGGELVSYNGQLYRAKWWTNTTPGSDSSWELVSGNQNNDDGLDIPTYVAGTAYTQGQQVMYNQNVYEAKWWTNTLPGSDDSWKIISN
ncbi:MAG TPA: chitinase, partial [Firmicutes bacterium]|nr:chitinase [Bacillota bacterium]